MTRAALCVLIVAYGCAHVPIEPPSNTVSIETDSPDAELANDLVIISTTGTLGHDRYDEKAHGWSYRDGLRLVCGRCRLQGQKSQVYVGGCTTTLMNCPSYYDEEGNFVAGDCNATWCNYTCSEGHWWSEAI